MRTRVLIHTFRVSLIVLGVLVMLFMSSCSRYTTVKVRDADNTVDGRKTFNVFFKDGRVMQFMYAEEVLHGLSTGNWGYNEDIK
jgi:hypothetical protein